MLHNIITVNDGNGHTMGFQYTENLVSSDTLHLSNSMRVTKNNTNLRWSETFLGKLADVLIDLRNSKYQKQKPQNS